LFKVDIFHFFLGSANIVALFGVAYAVISLAWLRHIYLTFF